MATATKKIPPTSPPPPPQAGRQPSPSLLDRLVGVVDGIYHFLASLKLAVFSLSTLAFTLGYATFFEKWYGTAAVNEYIYRGPWFAVLLAFLAMNILCAALIRFPWKKRQTGFVVTHAGLLILLAGSFYSVRTSDEGQVGMLEGDVRDELVRTDYPVIRVTTGDPHSGEELREIELPFRPGAFPWGPDSPRPVGVVQKVLSLITFGAAGSTGTEGEVITQTGDPFKIVVKEHLTASDEATEHVEGPDGAPMARIRLHFKAPGMPEAQEAFPSEDSQWFLTDRKFYRAAREPMRGAPALVTFSVVDRPELVEDFLKPPADPGTKGVARFRYVDRSGHAKVYDWPLEGQQGKSVALPDSDLTVSLTEVVHFPTQERGLDRMLGSDPIPIALFKIQKAGGEPATHMALANLPMVPNLIPSQKEAASRGPAMAAIHYMVAPTIDPQVNRRFGQIDVLAVEDPVRHQDLYYRVYGRGKEGRAELRSAAEVSRGKPIVAFGGNANMPMTISFEVDDYLSSGVEKDICIPVEVPQGEMDQQVAACRVEMTVGDETKEFWLSRNRVDSLKPPPKKHVVFGDTVYSLAYDVDRKPLGFDVKLNDFEIDFEPGTPQPTKFESTVRLTDKPESCDLSLMTSVNDVGEIPQRGRDLLIVASVKGVLHFRSFDFDGKRLVDTDEEKLTEKAKELEALKGQLAGLWPPHVLTKGEKRRVIEAATAMGLRDDPRTIWMNHPTDHRGYTFYQMRYVAERDPRTARSTGRFQSVFQVATNPGRPIIYGGCLLVVLGTFLQFYMRAGVFTDGGKRERDQAAARARAAATKAREAGLETPESAPAAPDPTEKQELL